MSKIVENPDVICQFKSDGSIIPIKFRIINDDGEYQEFLIKGYKLSGRKDTYKTADGVYIHGNTDVFNCYILILGQKKEVRLYFDRQTCHWILGY